MTAGEESQAPQGYGSQWFPCRRVIVMLIGGGVAPADIPVLCARLEALLEGNDAAEVACDVGGIVDPDAVTVDALARLQLTAQRRGHHLRLRNASFALRELLACVGLCDVLLCAVDAFDASG